MIDQKKFDWIPLISVLVVFCFVALTATAGTISYQSIYDESINTLRQQNNASINLLEKWLLTRANQVENNAMLLRDPDISMNAMRRHFREQTETFDGVLATLVGFPDGSMFSGGESSPLAGFHAPDRPWYSEAVEFPGKTIFTSPYFSIVTNQLTFAATRTINNHDDSQGVTAASLCFATVALQISQNNTTNRYTFILDPSGDVLFHPDSAFLPSDAAFQNVYDVLDGRYAEMFDIIQSEGFYVGDIAIHVGSMMESTGWYVITRIPITYILESTMPTVYVLVATAFLAIGTLVVALIMLRKVRIAMKNELELNEMNQRLIHSSPFIMSIWNAHQQIVAINQQATNIFGISSAEEYAGRFLDLSPEYQPCGTPSSQKVTEMINAGFASNIPFTFEWMHQTPNGKLMPSEVTLVQFTRKGERMIAAYTVDLRPLREAEERVKLMLDATPLAISLYDSNSNLLDCNQEALNMFMLSDKSKYKDIATTKILGVQSDKAESNVLFETFVAEAFKNGSAHAEFLSAKSDGTVFPSEATWVRVKYKDSVVVVEYLRDLTIEKSAQQREREANEFTQLLMDQTPLCIEMWDENRNLIYCNQRILDISGVHTFEDYKHRFAEFSYTEQIAPDKEAENMFDKAKRDGHVHSVATRLTASEDLLHYEVHLIHTTRQDKDLFIGYGHDISQVKNAIAKVYEADERASLMMGATPISCFMLRIFVSEELNTSFEIIDCNQAALDLFGFSYHYEAIERFSDVFPTQSENVSVEEIILNGAAKALEIGYDQFEFTLQRLDGEPVPCEVTLVRVEYQNEPTLIVFINDLRLVKAMLTKERNARKLSQTFLDAAPFFVEIWDENLNLIECNEPAIKLFNLQDKEEYIRNYSKFSPEFQPCGTPSFEKIRAYVTKTLTDGHARIEWMHIGSDGKPLPVDVVFVRIQHEYSNIVVLYSQDLRPIKDAMEREREAAEESQAKTQFLARMSHEIRTPMNSVMGIAEIELQKSIHSISTVDAFQRIYNSSKLLLSIINDILDLSKVEAGKMEIIPAMYETASLIADIVQLNIMYIGSKKIEFELEVDERLPIFLVGDELRIKQILNNLLSNAFKYTSTGEVKLMIKTGETTEDGSIMLVISVSDTGQGISKEQIDKMFSIEYTRFNLEQNREIEGSGLGMSITYSLVKMMEGDIKVESEPNKGSTFIVSLPQKKKDAQVLGKEAAKSLQNFDSSKIYLKKSILVSHEPMPYGRVLAVDDIETNLHVIKGMLEPYKLKVDVVESGKEAIAKIEDGQIYDIIFMDHMMPDMDGIEATKMIRDAGYSYPIVALTANATFGVSQTFIDNGFSGFISKPIDSIKLNECLMNFIYAKQPEEAIAAARSHFSGTHQHKDEGVIISEKLLKSFLVDVKKSMAVLEPIMQMSEMDDKAFKAYTIQTHGLKSVLYNVGFKSLSREAGILEDAVRKRDMDIIKNSTPLFLEEILKIVHSYSSRKTEDTPKVVEDSAFIAEHLAAISVACENYNIMTVKDLIRTLKATPLSVHTQTCIDDIEECLMVGDYDDAAILAKHAVEKYTSKEV